MTSSTLQKRNHREINSSYFRLVLILLGIFLNQSSVIFGINMSISDICLLLLITYLFVGNKLLIPWSALFFFLTISFTTVFTAAFITPYQYNVGFEPLKIANEYLKLVVLLFYFILGYVVMKENKMTILFEWYSKTAIIIGIIGIIFALFNIELFRDILFFGQIRFRGFMNDPNYFSVIMVSALPYFARNNKPFHVKTLLTFIVFIGVIVSGSKTGLIVLLLYLLFIFGEIIIGRIPKGYSFKTIIMILGIIIVFFVGILFQFSDIDNVSEVLPTFGRIIIVFSDFDSALNEQGSGRGTAWSGAIEIIKNSPILGIGIGTYGDVVYSIANHGSIAHNTFLQLSVEWGLLFAGFFFLYLISILIRISKKKFNFEGIIGRDIILIMLIGSIAISLNNVRILWLIIGGIMCNLRFEKVFYIKNR